MAEANVTVSIERAINDALRDLFQSRYDQFGVVVTRVDIDWTSIEKIGQKKRMVVTAVQCLGATGYENQEAWS